MYRGRTSKRSHVHNRGSRPAEYAYMQGDDFEDVAHNHEPSKRIGILVAVRPPWGRGHISEFLFRRSWPAVLSPLQLRKRLLRRRAMHMWPLRGHCSICYIIPNCFFMSVLVFYVFQSPHRGQSYLTSISTSLHIFLQPSVALSKKRCTFALHFVEK